MKVFGQANNIAAFFADEEQVEGILGMGFPELANSGAVPIVNNLLSSLNQPLFTFWLDQ